MHTFTPIGQYRATFSDEESKHVAFSWWMKLFVLLVLEARLVAVDQFVFCSDLVYFPEPQSFSRASTLLWNAAQRYLKKLENKNTSLRRTPAVSFG